MNVLVHACGWVEKKYLDWWCSAKICGTLRQEQGGKGEPFCAADGTDVDLHLSLPSNTLVLRL